MTRARMIRLIGLAGFGLAAVVLGPAPADAQYRGGAPYDPGNYIEDYPGYNYPGHAYGLGPDNWAAAVDGYGEQGNGEADLDDYYDDFDDYYEEGHPHTGYGGFYGRPYRGYYSAGWFDDAGDYQGWYDKLNH